jgi:pimeloyl-ACP methyl ester carboxylesterase
MNPFIKKVLIQSIAAKINLLSHFAPQAAASQAFDIFCTPRKGKITSKNKEFLTTATRQQTLHYEDMPIQCYEWQGNGATILLAHGWESNSARWKNLIKSLQKADFHIVALDAPAHGGSGSSIFHAIRYAAFIDVVSRHYRPLGIVGHSVGGMATVLYLSNYKHTIQKASVLGIPSDLTNIFKNYCEMMGYNEKVANAMNTLFEEKFGQSPAYYKTWEFAKKINIPALVIHDLDDDICPYEGSVKTANTWQNAQMFSTTGLGHGYQDRKVYHAIRDFMK